jgi:hypothetical protein
MKSFIFARRDPKVEAEHELREAELELLSAESAAEHADAIVAYNTSRIRRLKDYLGHDDDSPVKPGSEMGRAQLRATTR